jgi:hypothetical protein
MIPETTNTNTNQMTLDLKLVGIGDKKPAAPPRRRSQLRPELQEAMDANWERSKEAYRYLGR